MNIAATATFLLWWVSSATVPFCGVSRFVVLAVISLARFFGFYELHRARPQLLTNSDHSFSSPCPQTFIDASFYRISLRFMNSARAVEKYSKRMNPNNNASLSNLRPGWSIERQLHCHIQLRSGTIQPPFAQTEKKLYAPNNTTKYGVRGEDCPDTTG